jgi:hypothetical protein
MTLHAKPTSPPSSAPGTSLAYITVGSILAIWSAVWYIAFRPETRWGFAICLGLFLTGVAFLVIGFGVGRIGREARHAELPPADDTARVVATAPPPQAVPNGQGTTPTGNTVIQA